VTLVQFRHFVALARAGSFVRASAGLNMTQPALSRSIRALEEALGEPLFDRIGRRIELTQFGRETLVRVRQLLDDAGRLRLGGPSMDQWPSGRLRIGLSSGPGVLLSVPIFTWFAKHHPRLRVDLVRASAQVLTPMLREREVDALIIDLRSMRPAPDLRVDQVIELRGAFMCRKRHPLARRKRVSIEQLLNYPVASTPLSDELARILVERYGAVAHPEQMVRFVTDEIAHLIELTRRTDAVLLAVRAVAPELHELEVSPALDAMGRFGLVTLARKSEGVFVPIIRRVMVEVMSEAEARVGSQGAPGATGASTPAQLVKGTFLG
jgi:DNA-binding transcriptional LysR family regulator